MLLANALPLYNVFDSSSSPIEGVKYIGSIVNKLFEEFDVIPSYMSRKELKLIYQVIVKSHASPSTQNSANMLDFIGFVRLLVSAAVYALSKTSAYVTLYPEVEAKIDVMLTKWGFADPQKLKLVEAKLQNN